MDFDTWSMIPNRTTKPTSEEEVSYCKLSAQCRPYKTPNTNMVFVHTIMFKGNKVYTPAPWGFTLINLRHLITVVNNTCLVQPKEDCQAVNTRCMTITLSNGEVVYCVGSAERLASLIGQRDE